MAKTAGAQNAGRWAWRWLPVVVWMALIFVVSAQPDIPQAGDPTLDFVIKKVMHATAYGILAWLWYRALVNGEEGGGEARVEGEEDAANGVGRRRWRSGLAIVAFAACVGYAATDEWHQQHVPGRHGVARDVVIDGAGAVVGLALIRRRGMRRD